jgi:quercetin dioxygenase-like cupin family protein
LFTSSERLTWQSEIKRKGTVVTATQAPTVEEALKTHNAPIVRRPDDIEPKMGRFKNTTQMVFHPSEEDPTQPNAGIINYLPGSGFPLHKHDFAQMWYVVEGECSYGDTTLKQGDLVYMQDPHFEYEMHTENGCRILFLRGADLRGTVQRQGGQAGRGRRPRALTFSRLPSPAERSPRVLRQPLGRPSPDPRFSKLQLESRLVPTSVAPSTATRPVHV